MNKTKKLILLIAVVLPAISAFSQSGIITGTVRSNDGRNLTNAIIRAVGTSDSTFTDMEGRFKMNLPVGHYLIQIETTDFEWFSDSAKIEDGKETSLSAVLNPITVGKMKEANIHIKRKAAESSVAGAIQSKQLDVRMIEQVSADDIKRTTSRTTGDVIKRIPGATIMEGKFANIRGMYDRYNTGYLNGAPLPSTESDRKAFSFDIIPATLLDNIQIIKSGTPDLIGDFGGGIIRINTKSIPVKMTQSFNFGLQFNSITTFRDVNSFNVAPSEYFGITSPSHKIPNIAGSLAKPNAEFNASESQKFNNDWSVKSMRPMLSPRFNYTIGVPFKLKKQREIGLLMSINYSMTQKYSDGLVNRTDLSDNRPISSFNDKLFSTNVQNGGILNLSYKFNNKNRIDWKNLYTINYDASSTFRSGVSDYENGVSTDGYSNLVNFNRLATTQMNGTHILGKKQTTLTWLVNYGNTSREIPDFRIAQYASFGPNDRYFVTNDFFNSGSGRFFSNLKENTFSASADMQHSFRTGKLVTNLKYGVFNQQRNRNFTSREFVYAPVGKVIKSESTPVEDLSQNKIAANGIYLQEKTALDLDQYSGKSVLNAAYVMFENHYPLFKTGNKLNLLKVIYGLRFEQFSQILKNDIFTKIYKRDVSNTGVNNDFLPSINIIAPVTSKTGVRFAYYKTLNRPEMRELAPFSFYNFNLNSEVVGNTNLRRAIIHNFDARFEIFPGKEDMLTVGAFAKRIINPIEFSLDPTQAQIRTFTYRNEKSADIQGIEIELRKKMTFIGRRFAPVVFNNLSFYGNFSLIHSNVHFNSNSTGTANRPLQGQSPYVANFSLFYDHQKSGVTASVNFNKIGSRIAYIGVPPSLQPFGMDIYEFGRSVLDFQVGKNFGKSGNIKLTVGDVLAQKTSFYQDLNHNKKYDEGTDNTLFSYTNGRTVTITYGYTF